MATVLVSAEFMCSQEAVSSLSRESSAPIVISFIKGFDELCESVNSWEAFSREAFWQQCTDALCKGTSIGYRIQAEAKSIDHLRILRREVCQPAYALFVEHFLRNWFSARGNCLEVKVWEYDCLEESETSGAAGSKPAMMS